jgi:hypothetical protein
VIFCRETAVLLRGAENIQSTTWPAEQCCQNESDCEPPVTTACNTVVQSYGKI